MRLLYGYYQHTQGACHNVHLLTYPTSTGGEDVMLKKQGCKKRPYLYINPPAAYGPARSVRREIIEETRVAHCPHARITSQHMSTNKGLTTARRALRKHVNIRLEALQRPLRLRTG